MLLQKIPLGQGSFFVRLQAYDLILDILGWAARPLASPFSDSICAWVTRRTPEHPFPGQGQQHSRTSARPNTGEKCSSVFSLLPSLTGSKCWPRMGQQRKRQKPASTDIISSVSSAASTVTSLYCKNFRMASSDPPHADDGAHAQNTARMVAAIELYEHIHQMTGRCPEWPAGHHLVQTPLDQERRSARLTGQNHPYHEGPPIKPSVAPHIFIIAISSRR